jgi:hypothetical protein
MSPLLPTSIVLVIILTRIAIVINAPAMATAAASVIPPSTSSSSSSSSLPRHHHHLQSKGGGGRQEMETEQDGLIPPPVVHLWHQLEQRQQLLPQRVQEQQGLQSLEVLLPLHGVQDAAAPPRKHQGPRRLRVDKQHGGSEQRGDGICSAVLAAAAR